MRKWTGLTGILLSILLLTGLCAAETGHYVNGVEGIKAATLPPPGNYYRMYNTFYNADTLTDGDGNEIDIGFDAFVFANVHRFIWISDIELLGGNYGADFFIPLLYSEVEIGAFGIEEDQFGLGDLIIEPLIISWHGRRYDAATALAFFLPTGDYNDTNPASPGKGFWTVMGTLGGTYYLDPAKKWSASILARYETHFEEDTDMTPGDDFHFEWGLGRTIASDWIWDVGVAGYCQWQVTDDDGPGTSKDNDQVYAAGPHISAMIPKLKMGISLMNQWEFEAQDRTEGSVTTLTLTRMF